MRPCGMRAAGWVCVLLAAVSADPDRELYTKVGDDAVLKPHTDSVSAAITSIMWKQGLDIAMQWDGNDVDSYRQFEVRAQLNVSSGEMTITRVTLDDSALYTPEINHVQGAPIRLIVISPVPVPTVSESCDAEGTSCELACQGNITNAEPVSIKWTSGGTVLEGSSMVHRITKEDSSNRTEFSCELKNPVSQESSKPFMNPLITKPTPDPGPEEGLKIHAGLTVFISLLAAVLLLALFHRWKAGVCFYQKDSMPWEADFWGKTPRDAADSNGTTARQEKGQTDEETPMT